jgi:hypothetical protein
MSFQIHSPNKAFLIPLPMAFTVVNKFLIRLIIIQIVIIKNNHNVYSE